jgi:glycosyltransferase involved in cell wall biosynthesis
MKILLLTDINSPHSRKWATGLAGRGIRIGIFSISSPAEDWYTASAIEVFVPVKFNLGAFSSGIFKKIKYLKLVHHLAEVIREFKPDVLHAHYASSYGLLGALSGFHPFVLSVWGSDIYFFPRIPILGPMILKFNFRKADKILSTSHAMTGAIRTYTEKEVSVTPFGIDLDVFSVFPATPVFSTGDLVVGTIKALEPVYGVEILIRAFQLVKEKLPGMPVKLLIVGGGSLEGNLKSMVRQSGLEKEVVFTGKVSPAEVPQYYNRIDIFAALSLSESFGVSVLEASASEKPVVVSDAGGLPEVVVDGQTGFIVPAGNAEKAMEAIEKLIMDKALRDKMGKNGRAFVSQNFNVVNSIDRMVAVYEAFVSSSYKPIKK